MSPDTGRRGRDEPWIDSPFLWEETSRRPDPDPPATAPEPADPQGPEPEDVAVAGDGWVVYAGQDLAPAAREADVDTSLVEPGEMVGVWLTTELGRSSPVWIDGQPIEPEEIGVAPEIADRLRDWAAMWQRDWDAQRGWSPRARIDDYEALGLWLAWRVKDAVGAVKVTLQLAHLGRCHLTEVQGAQDRAPHVVRLHPRPDGAWPVSGVFVTDSGVGSFTSEVNARVEAWTRVHHRAHRDGAPSWDASTRAAYLAERDDLAVLMRTELGPDYVLDVVDD